LPRNAEVGLFEQDPRKLSLILSEEEARESTRLKMVTSDTGLTVP